MNKREIGNKYETIAVEYLKNQGYRIIARNYRCKKGEIDIVAIENNTLVFLEVKYRTDTKHGHPLEAVNKYKQKAIYNSALFYILENNIATDFAIRFDVVSILGTKIEVIKNAFGVM